MNFNEKPLLKLNDIEMLYAELELEFSIKKYSHSI